MAMRKFFSHWKILLALVAVILLAILTLRPGEAGAEPPLAERLRQHALAIAAGAGDAEAAFAAHGYRVRHQQYGTGSHAVRTVEASLANVAPGAQPERVFIVGSRYDSGRGLPDGDGAAGAAAVLELAGLLKHLRPARGTEIRFVLFPPARDAIDAADGYSADRPPPAGQSGNFIAFVGTRAASGPVRQALAAFRDDTDFLVAGIAAPYYVQAVTLAAHAPASEGAAALLITDTAFLRYPYFRTAQAEGETEHESMARVVTGLARTLSALAAAPSS
jgi:hypothetical protein